MPIALLYYYIWPHAGGAKKKILYILPLSARNIHEFVRNNIRHIYMQMTIDDANVVLIIVLQIATRAT